MTLLHCNSGNRPQSYKNVEAIADALSAIASTKLFASGYFVSAYRRYTEFGVMSSELSEISDFTGNQKSIFIGNGF